jgi:hypothetical protein
MILNGITALVHAAAEILSVLLALLIFKESFVGLTINAYYILVGVGAVTVGHSVVDFLIAYTIYKPLEKNKLL